MNRVFDSEKVKRVILLSRALHHLREEEDQLQKDIERINERLKRVEQIKREHIGSRAGILHALKLSDAYRDGPGYHDRKDRFMDELSSTVVQGMAETQ